MRYTKEEYTKRLESLTPTLKDFVLSIEASELVEKLSQKYNLNEDSVYDLCHYITLYLMRYADKNELVSEIQNILSINSKEAREEVNNIIKTISEETGFVEKEQNSKVEVENVGEREATSNPSLNHQNILSEIENPTPSIQNKDVDANTDTKTKDSADITPASNIMPQGKTTNLTTEAPSLAEAIGSIPNIGGFKPIENTAHPAEAVAQKLNANLNTTTSSPVKEVYHVKPLDPYHEPVE